MKIKKIETFLVDAKLRNWVFVKVYTDEGISGIGEASTECCELAVVTMVKQLEQHLIDKDPFDVAALIKRMYQVMYWRDSVIISSAISGIEQSLWDIIGKRLGVPVYKLFGGRCEEKVRAYVSLSALPNVFSNLDELVSSVKKVIDMGYTALKIDPFIFSNIETQNKLKSSVECVRAIRDIVGNDIEIMVEGHGQLNPIEAMRMANALEPMRPYFFEEPIDPSNLNALAKIVVNTKIPIAIGERVFSKTGFTEILEKRLAEIIQPDPSHVGGILETKKIAGMAESYQVLVALHNPSGPISTSVCTHISTAIPNASMLEGLWEWDVPWRNEVVKGCPKVEKGYIRVSEKPGLGVEIDEDAVNKFPYSGPKRLLW
jgi:galactonate dehydratase